MLDVTRAVLLVQFANKLIGFVLTMLAAAVLIFVVLEVLPGDPALVNSAATTDGWLWKMKLADEGQLAGLLDEAGYKAHIG